jgi:Xaa-Pro aminopeptidase
VNYILKDESALFYECSFSCDNGILLVIENEKFFITDGRYIGEANESIEGAIVIDGGRDIIKATKDHLIKSGISEITLDPKEWSIEEFNTLQSDKISFELESNISQKKRIIKSDSEIEFIKEAAGLGEYAFYKFSQYLQKDGLYKSESYLAYHFSNILKDFGKYDLSFNPIVAIDQSSSYPHATPSPRELNGDSLILIDAGIKYKRYCSDRSRTSQFSHSIDFITSQSFTDKKKQHIYDTVLKAHDRAIESIRVGMKASDVDKVARSVIEDAGFSKEFLHSTGHGVGLDIHELPVISKNSDTIIQDNMVFTIEPGLYFGSEYGVRIEDMVVVNSGRAEII